MIGPALRAPPCGAAGAAGVGEFAAVPGGNLFAVVLIGGGEDAPVGFAVAVHEEVELVLHAGFAPADDVDRADEALRLSPEIGVGGGDGPEVALAVDDDDDGLT